MPLIYHLHFDQQTNKTERPNNWIAIGSLLLALCVMLTLGCQKTDETITEDTLQIGLLLPLSGAAASAGESARAGATLAMQDVNDFLSSGGSGLRVEFTIKDTGADPETALQQLMELAGEGSRFVIGPYSSADAAATVDYANQEGVILLSPSSVASSLAIADDNLFRLVPSDGNQAAAVTALFDYDGIETIIPVVRDDVWGDGLIDDVSQLLGQEGKTLFTPIKYDPSNVNSADIAAQVASAINQALQQSPASQVAVYLLSFGEGASILSAAAQEPGCALVKWYGSSAFANNADLLNDPVAAQFAMQQSFRCPSFAPDPSAADLWEPIQDQLVSELGRAPEVFALTSYDAVWLMTEAYRNGPASPTAQSFRAALEQAAQYHYGITGRTAFDPAGDRKYAYFNFWGLSKTGAGYEWKAQGHYDNASGQLVID